MCITACRISSWSALFMRLTSLEWILIITHIWSLRQLHHVEIYVGDAKSAGTIVCRNACITTCKNACEDYVHIGQHRHTWDFLKKLFAKVACWLINNLKIKVWVDKTVIFMAMFKKYILGTWQKKHGQLINKRKQRERKISLTSWKVSFLFECCVHVLFHNLSIFFHPWVCLRYGPLYVWRQNLEREMLGGESLKVRGKRKIWEKDSPLLLSRMM